MIRSAAYGVARLGQVLAGGLGRVRELAGGGATLHLVNQSPGICDGGRKACAPPPWLDWGMILRNPGHNVYLPVASFSGHLSHMVIVHELAHIIDWHSRIEVGGRVQTFSAAWRPYASITQYGKSGPWEKFAEAVAVAVFGRAYKAFSGRFLLSDAEVRRQSGRVLELLNGWR